MPATEGRAMHPASLSVQSCCILSKEKTDALSVVRAADRLRNDRADIHDFKLAVGRSHLFRIADGVRHL